MEIRVNKAIQSYVTSFKDDIRNKAAALRFEDNTKINDLIEFVYDYERLSIPKDTIEKTKRPKLSVQQGQRCIAKRANDEQCTRRRKEGCDLCGTHFKGVPYGVIKPNEETNVCNKTLSVFAQDICGIVYYIDDKKNVYKTEDIISGKENPQIVAKWAMVDNIYTIPDFGI
jgi:hypothetical protein